MAVHGKCLKNGCPFRFDDAEHMEDVLSKLAAHYRTEHPTKSFWESRYKEQMDVLNFDVEEAVANYCGPRWRERLENQEIQARHITHACGQVCRYPDNYKPEVIEGVMALSEEHGVAIPDPYAAAVGRGNHNPEFIDVPYLDEEPF